MIRHRIAILNRSTVVSDVDAQEAVKALQVQVDRDFGPVWGIGAKLSYVAKSELLGWQGSWNLVILDTSDEAQALGYHDLSPEGLPLGKAFAKTDQMNGYSVSVTLSHELLEMLADPNINLTAQNGSDFYAYENCDPVEADSLGYEHDGVLLSDFVTPAWFSPDAPGPWSFKENVSGPFLLAPGGYISIWSEGSWYNATAQSVNRPPVGSRRERRQTPRRYWQKSVV